MMIEKDLVSFCTHSPWMLGYVVHGFSSCILLNRKQTVNMHPCANVITLSSSDYLLAVSTDKMSTW